MHDRLGQVAQVVQSWLAGLRAEKTRKAYTSDLKIAERLLGHNDFSRLDRAELAKLLSLMKEDGYAPNSIRRMNCSMRSLMGELAAYELIRPAAVFGVRKMRLDLPRTDRAGRYLDRAERAKLFAATAKTARSEEEKLLLDAVLALGLGGGLRFSEVRGLKPGDYDPKTGEVRIRAGKGGKDRCVYLAGEAKRLMDQVIGKGVRFSAFTHDLWDSLRYHADLGDVLVFHDLRRTFASDAWDAGIDGSTIAAMLGHSNIQTSMLYDRRSEERKKRAAMVIMGKHETR